MTLALPPGWALPAAIEAYKRRQDIASAWRSVLNVIAGKKRHVVVTGMSGAGKTMLLSALTGAAERRGFRPPERSLGVERARVQAKEPRRRIALAVVPGQPGYHRVAAQDDLLLSKKPVDGVVHVVCNGYAAFHAEAVAMLRRQGASSLESLRTYYHDREAEDFKETLDLLRRSWKKHHKPFWMMVAVAKADLYQEGLPEAAARYAPGGDGPFIDLLREFQGRIGSDNFQWDAQPVCSWLETFTYGDVTISPQIDMMKRDHSLAMFASTLERHCV
ncbi:ATP-binding protein [Polyangium spumosum]|uniref:G domain-containing protein n=1 Tax=Polyangium spumosum TaxID=889282 RepID=A0A6N7PSL3_9BACT|nr:ATP-binding protein [Polyangium spumosum]MRG95162.1 hypothetical protein [Polyangium spumosum]